MRILKNLKIFNFECWNLTFETKIFQICQNSCAQFLLHKFGQIYVVKTGWRKRKKLLIKKLRGSICQHLISKFFKIFKIRACKNACKSSIFFSSSWLRPKIPGEPIGHLLEFLKDSTFEIKILNFFQNSRAQFLLHKFGKIYVVKTGWRMRKKLLIKKLKVESWNQNFSNFSKFGV